MRSKKPKYIIAILAAALVFAFAPVLSRAEGGYRSGNQDPLLGPTVEITESAAGQTIIYGNGFPLIVADGIKKDPQDSATVVFWDNGAQPGELDAGDTLVYSGAGSGACFGGAKEGILEKDTKITVLGGYLGAIYGGGAKDSLLIGNTSIDVKTSRGCTAFFGGGQQDTVDGNVNIVLGKTAEEEATSVPKEQQKETQPIYGVDEKSTVTGAANITVTDGERTAVCGVAATGMAKDVNLCVKNGTVKELKGTQGTVSGNIAFSFEGGVTGAVESGAAAGAKTLSVSGAPVIGTEGRFIALDDLADNTVQIAGALNGTEKSIRIGFREESPAGRTVARGAQAEADAQKFDVNGIDTVQGNAELAVKDGNVNVTSYYNITLGADEVVKAYPSDPPTVEVPKIENGKEFMGYFSDAENKQYYNADGTPAEAAYTISKDVTLSPRYKDPATTDTPNGANNTIAQEPVVTDTFTQEQQNTDGEASYQVDIGWGEMKFVYKRSGQVWDAQTHSYVEDQSGEWEGYTGGNNRVTVKNHSNRDISAGFALSELPEGLSSAWFADEARTTPLDTLSLPFCPEGATEEMIPTGSCYLGLFGFPSTLKQNEDFKRVGLITVSILPVV